MLHVAERQMIFIVGYLTPDSDLDLAPDPINSGLCLLLDTSICDVVLKYPSGDLRKLF